MLHFQNFLWCSSDSLCVSAAGLTSTLQSEYAAVTAPPNTTITSGGSNMPSSSAAAKDNRDAVNSPAGDAAEAVAAHGDNTTGAGHPAPQALVYLAALSPPLAVALAHPGSFLTLLSVRARPPCFVCELLVYLAALSAPLV